MVEEFHPRIDLSKTINHKQLLIHAKIDLMDPTQQPADPMFQLALTPSSLLKDVKFAVAEDDTSHSSADADDSIEAGDED
jgi:hypothetical protein